MDTTRFCIEESEARRKQWAYLTEGVDDGSRRGKQKRLVIEAMLDQEKRWLEEANTTAGIGAFTTYAFPMVRRIFPKLIAQSLVSVQPMSQPTGKVFFLDFKYGNDSAVGEVRSGDRLDQVRDKTYADNVEAGTPIREVNFNIYSEDVSAKEKKLKAKWTIESQQDLKAYHGLSAEDELMAVCSDEVIREIDAEILDDLLAVATAGNVNWDINAPSVAPWTSLDPKVYKSTLYEAIVDANNLVFKKRYRNATWLVADSDTCTRLEKLEGFKLTENPDDSYNVGIHEFGTLRNRWTLYKHPWFSENKILVGFKGASWLETGYVYCPYIPLYTTPLFVDPDDMQLKRAMMSRYAKKAVITDCYATVTLRAS